MSLAVLDPEQESNVSMWESATDSAGRSNTSIAAVHGALIARSSETSMGERANASDMSLDTVASGKAASGIVGTFSDLANAVADAGSMAVKAVCDRCTHRDTLSLNHYNDCSSFARHISLSDARGETLGTAAGNVFSAVGNRVIKAPKMRFDKLDSELKDLANELGDEALVVGNVLQGVARTTLEARYKLAGHLLELATEVYDKSREIATQVAFTAKPEP